jgi:lipopolysaccharide assembly protein A
LRLVHWVVTAPATLILVGFAVSNRGGVAVSLWPILGPSQVPLYVVVMSALLIGFCAGELVAWINAGSHRRLARERRRRIEALERELAAAQAKTAPPNNPQTALVAAREA